MHRHLPVTVLVVFFGQSACSADLSIPPGAVVSCSASEPQCPAGYVCRETIGRCVPSGATSDGLALVGEAVWDKKVGREGDTLRVRFTLDGPPVVPITVSLAGDNGPIAMLLEATSLPQENTFAFTYVVNGTEPERLDVAAMAYTLDELGTSSNLPLGDVGFDFTAPEASSFDWRRTKPAWKHADVVSLTGSTEADTQLLAARLLTSNGTLLLDSVALAKAVLGRRDITGQVDLAPLALTDGDTIVVEIDLTDPYGNAATAATEALLLDFTAPQEATVVIAGGAVTTVTTEVSVALDAVGATEVYIAGDVQEGINTLRWIATALPASKSVPLTASSGLHTITALFRDGAGNESAVATATITLVLDGTSPTVTNFECTSRTPTNDPVVSYAITGDDNQGLATYLVTTTAATPTPDSVTAPFAANVSTASDTLTLPADGDHVLYAWVKDKAGLLNTSPMTCNVTLDRSAPSVTAFSVAKEATYQTSVGATLTASDNVGIQGRCVTESPTPPLPTDTCFAADLDSVTLADDGLHTLYPWALDVAGNVSPLSDQLDDVFLDTERPTITTFALEESSPTASTTVHFDLVFDDPSPSAGGLEARVAVDGEEAPAYSSTPPASYSHPAGGTRTLRATVRDVAGNVSLEAVQTICIDIAPPTVQLGYSGGDVPPNTAIAGLTLTADDDCGVVKYLVRTSSSATPSVSDFTLAYSGATTLDVTTSPSDMGALTVYAWTLDHLDRVSEPASVTINVVGTPAAAVPDATGHYRGQPDIAVTSSKDTLTVWSDCSTGCDIHAVHRSPVGEALGADLTINTSGPAGAHDHPRVCAMADGTFAVVWNDGDDIRMRFVGGDGQGDDDFLVASGAGDVAPAVACARPASTAPAHPADTVVVWQDGSGVKAARVDTDGAVIGAVIGVASDVPNSPPAAAATAAGAFAVAYAENANVHLVQYVINADNSVTQVESHVLWGPLHSPLGATFTPITRSNPSVAMLSSGQAVVVFETSGSEQPMCPPPPEDCVPQMIPVSALDAAFVDADGTESRALIIGPLTSGPSSYVLPSATAAHDEDGFVVTWGDGGSGGPIMSKSYDNAGDEQGASFSVSPGFTDPARTALAAGVVTAVWSAAFGGGSGVYFRRYPFAMGP